MELVNSDNFREFYFKTYSTDFEINHMGTTYDWVDECSKKLTDIITPISILDLGCGPGRWLLGAYKNGCKDILGMEYSLSITGPAIPKEMIPFIIEGDVSQSFNLNRTFDCVWSFEVAEHIQPEFSIKFVENIINHSSNLIIITAAPPGQDGVGHINCKPMETWIEYFEDFGATRDKNIETNIKDIWGKIPPWYMIQNLIVFRR